MEDRVTTTPISRRAFGAAAAGTAAAAGLSACGSSAGTSGKTPLRFYWWGSDPRHQYTLKIIENFNATHPDIEVKGEYSEWAGYWDKLATSMAANDAPDIIQMDAVYLRSYGDRGALYDISRFTNVDTSRFDKAALETGRTPDGLLGLVISIVPLALITNTEIIEKAGAKLPDDKAWTWDDYEKLSAQITDAGLKNVYGMSTGGLDEPTLTHWVTQHGGKLYGQDGKVSLDADVVTSWWEYALDTLKNKAATPATLGIERSTASLDQGGIALNQNAFAPMWATQITALAPSSGQPLTLVRPPTQTVGGSTGLFYKPGMFWSVSSRTKYPEAAATFLEYLASDPGVADLMLTERGILADTTLRQQITPKLSAMDKLAVDYTQGLADVIEPTPPSAPAGASDIGDMVSRYGSDVLFGQQKPAKAAKALVEELTTSVESA